MMKMKVNIKSICAVVALVAGTVLPAVAQKAAADPDLYRPKVDVFAGYSFWAPSGSVQGHPFSSIVPGFHYGGDYFFDKAFNKPVQRHLGVSVQGSYHRSDPCVNCVYTIGAGPALRSRRGKFLFTGHGLLGAAEVGGPNIPSTGNGSFYQNPKTWGFLFQLGGSVDVPLKHHLWLRMAQVDYQNIHVNFGPATATSGGSANINAIQISGGLMVSWKNLNWKK